jgi:aminoglycoside 2''-phosphotransferase
LSVPATSEPPKLDELTARIRGALRALPFTTAELVTYGEDNLIVVLDQKWIVRFPRNDEYRARFAAELNLLDVLGPLSQIPVPRYEHVAPDKSFGAYRRIPGVELSPDRFAEFSESGRKAALISLAEFLSTLHALPQRLLIQPDGMIARTWSGEQFAALYRGMRRAKIARVVSPDVLLRFDAFHDVFENSRPGPSRLVHDDITDDHILTDAGGISGIIDFSDASFGDPAIDFAFFWRLGEASLDSVLSNYRFATSDRTLKTRSHWTYVRYMINLLAYGSQPKWGVTPEQVLAELDPHLKRLGF